MSKTTTTTKETVRIGTSIVPLQFLELHIERQRKIIAILKEREVKHYPSAKLDPEHVPEELVELRLLIKRKEARLTQLEKNRK